MFPDAEGFAAINSFALPLKDIIPSPEYDFAILSTRDSSNV